MKDGIYFLLSRHSKKRSWFDFCIRRCKIYPVRNEYRVVRRTRSSSVTKRGREYGVPLLLLSDPYNKRVSLKQCRLHWSLNPFWLKNITPHVFGWVRKRICFSNRNNLTTRLFGRKTGLPSGQRDRRLRQTLDL